MKFAFMNILGILFLLIAPALSAEELHSTDMRIIYSSNINGTLTPSRGWGGKISGGLARLKTLVETKRMEKDLLFVDAGNFTPKSPRNKTLITEIGVTAMARMGYTAVNASTFDFQAISTLSSMPEAINKIPFVSANFSLKTPKIKKFIITEINGVKIGITGITPALTDMDSTHPLFQVNRPVEALRSLIPDLKQHSDVIILLSLYSKQSTSIITEMVPGIDIIIAPEITARSISGDTNKSPHYLTSTSNCKTAGLADLSFDKNKNITNIDNTNLALGDDFPADPSIEEVTGNDIHQQSIKIGNLKMIEEAKALHKLSPKEYIEMLLKKNKQ